MKTIFVNGLVPNEPVTTLFLVTHKEIRQKKTGEPYLSLVLADRTGEIEAKMWDNVAEVMDVFDRDDFVKVKGLAQPYQNRSQFTIHKLRRLEEHEIESTDYFPCSKRDPEEMFVELRAIIDSLGSPHLRNLLNAIFANERTARLFKRAPAAKTIHHAYLGGLLEHVLSLCSLCRMMAAHYPGVDVDLLLTAAVLHDIGKIEELNYERSFSYSTPGQLLGHIVIGIQLVDENIRLLPDFPPKLRLLLQHMILSHHGELEFGSPKVPVFLEALLFHHLDNLDSKMEAMRVCVERDKQVDSEFTGWISALERVVLKKEKYLNQPTMIAVAPESRPASPIDAPERAQQAPAPPVVPQPPPAAPPRRAASTLFGDKLKAVLSEAAKTN